MNTRIHRVLAACGLRIALVAIAFAIPARVACQTAAPALLRVNVTDMANAPLSGANVVIVKNNTETVFFGQTNSRGSLQFSFDADSGKYRLVVRTVGYLETMRAIFPAPGDTIDVALTLAPVPRALDTVRAVAQYTSPFKRPYIDADEIAHSTKQILALGDVFGKLRIDLDYASHFKCQPDRLHGPVDPPLIQPPQDASFHRPPRLAHVYVDGRLIPYEWNPWYSIRAEDIAEARFVDCWDQSIPGLPPQRWPALYVVLKPGIVYDRAKGSHPMTDSLVDRPPAP